MASCDFAGDLWDKEEQAGKMMRLCLGCKTQILMASWYSEVFCWVISKGDSAVDMRLEFVLSALGEDWATMMIY